MPSYTLVMSCRSQALLSRFLVILLSMQVYVLLIALSLLAGSGILAWKAGRWMRRSLDAVRPMRLINPITRPAPLLAHSDLTAYPSRLEALELQLQEKIVLLDQQKTRLGTRLKELKGKGGRDDLTRKYTQDAMLLQNRQDSMRRILAQVWKTRSILLLRVHLAVTARQKPTLHTLPDPEAPNLDPARATRAFLEAASAVRCYLEEVETRRQDLAQLLPEPPSIAENNPAILESIQQEARTTELAYARLQEQMDRLADNLTYLGDHFETLVVMADPKDRMTREAGSAGKLLDEVDAALSSLEALASSVDPSTMDAAVSHLKRDISLLEEAGQEAAAEADASLEVAALLHSSPQ
jgi:hypothetical protein